MPIEVSSNPDVWDAAAASLERLAGMLSPELAEMVWDIHGLLFRDVS